MNSGKGKLNRKTFDTKTLVLKIRTVERVFAAEQRSVSQVSKEPVGNKLNIL